MCIRDDLCWPFGDTLHPASSHYNGFSSSRSGKSVFLHTKAGTCKNELVCVSSTWARVLSFTWMWFMWSVANLWPQVLLAHTHQHTRPWAKLFLGRIAAWCAFCPPFTVGAAIVAVVNVPPFSRPHRFRHPYFPFISPTQKLPSDTNKQKNGKEWETSAIVVHTTNYFLYIKHPALPAAVAPPGGQEPTMIELSTLLPFGEKGDMNRAYIAQNIIYYYIYFLLKNFWHKVRI